MKRVASPLCHSCCAFEAYGAKDTLVRSDKLDLANDGKFSVSQAAKNFVKGLISPITSMFESKKNFITGASMMAASATLVVATGGAATPILLAAGVTAGAIQGAVAIYKILKANDGDDIEKAFYDVGTASGAIGLSAAGAKGALKHVEIETEGLGIFSSTLKCFSSIKPLAVESFNTFKTNYYKTNIYNTLKPFLNPRMFIKFSKELASERQKNFDAGFAEILEVLPEDLRASLYGRAKSNKSIYSKLLDECFMKDKINKISKRTDLTELQKEVEIASLKKKETRYKSDINAVRAKINDLIGTRLILDDAGKPNIARLVNSLVEGINNNKIVIAEIKNYRGENGHFYFSKTQIESIKCAVVEKGQKIIVLEGKKQIKSSGYNAVQLKLIHKCGSLGELQIRGKLVDEVANYEHIPYDLKTGKDISRGSNKIGELLSPFKVAVKKLSESQYLEYERYLAKTYRYARREELGLNSRKVMLPENFDKILSNKSLHKLYEQTEKLPSRENAPILPAAQSAVGYDSLKLRENNQFNKKQTERPENV